MINKETVNNELEKSDNQDDVVVDTARMDVQCHLLIKDKDTGAELVNKRG